MGLKRFMLYAERPGDGETDVVYCWGFRGALAVAKKMSGWLDGAAVFTQDLDTLEETRSSPNAESGQVELEDTPAAGFVACSPRPRELESKQELAEAPPAPETSCLQAEVNLRHGRTMRLRLNL